MAKKKSKKNKSQRDDSQKLSKEANTISRKSKKRIHKRVAPWNTKRLGRAPPEAAWDQKNFTNQQQPADTKDRLEKENALSQKPIGKELAIIRSNIKSPDD